MIEKFICVGNANYDIFFRTDRMPDEHEKLRIDEVDFQFGGSASTTASWLSKLNENVDIIGCVGDDDIGSITINSYKRHGINTSLLQIKENINTGLAAIFVNPNSKRMISVAGANKYFDPNKINYTAFTDNTHIHIAYNDDNSIRQILTESKKRGLSTSIELNGNEDYEILRYVDYSFVNEDDFRRWFGKENPETLWKKLTNKTHSSLVITLGSRGAQVITGNSIYFAEVYPAEIIDRTGGGDSFDAGFLKAYAKKKSLDECLKTGLYLASKVISGRGARPEDINIDDVLNKFDLY